MEQCIDGLIQKFLKRINQGEFPPEMRSYREMFLSSRKAAVYELFLNQIGYHSLTGFAFLAYTYWMRTLYDSQSERASFSTFLANSLGGFFKLRLGFASISMLSEFWGAKIGLKKVDGAFAMSPHMKRNLLLK